jgi:hypothetical protein
VKRALAPLLAALAALVMAAAAPSASAECVNEERRVEQGAAALALPECRAYELVSPGHVVGQDGRATRVAVSGDRITYFSTRPSSSAKTSSYYYLALREAQGWRTESVAAQTAPAALASSECEQNVFFSPDLTLNVDEEGWFQADELARCKRNGEVLVPGEPNPYRNVFLHDVATDSNRLVNLTPASVVPANAKFQDASDDFSRIFFSSEAELVPDAPAGYNFYLWNDGVVRLLTYGPDGAPLNGELVEAAGHREEDGDLVLSSGIAPATGAVAADGSWAFFYANGALYGRSNPEQPQSAVVGGECVEPLLACTVQIDASQGPGASGGGIFWRADDAGRRVFFTAQSKLTPDSTAGPGAADLYVYDTETGELADLTVSSGESADVRGVVGAAADGAFVYFVANGVLAPGATPGTCKGATVKGQHCNLYVHHDDSTAFVATLSREDNLAWQEAITPEPDPRRKWNSITANASANGRFLAFVSYQQLTGYDNRNALNDIPEWQIFLYDAEADGGVGDLDCVSCQPNGERPHGPVTVAFDGNYGPGAPGGNASWKVNVVLDDGSVYFDSLEPLVSQDSNGTRDLYQYRDGQHRLISTGTYPGPVRFLGVSPSGGDVFFRTPEPLLGSDLDGENASIYDARVGGGFPQPPPSPPACSGEGCRGSSDALPAIPAPATAAGGSAADPKQRQSRRRNRCRRAKQRGKRRHCARGKKHQAGKVRRRDVAGGRR